MSDPAGRGLSSGAAMGQLMLLDHVRLMAQYNRWMNRKVYATAAQMSDESRREERGAFFGSVLGTLNHIMVGDLIWLKRLSALPVGYPSFVTVRAMEQPRALDRLLFESFDELASRRGELDDLIIRFCDELTEKDLGQPLAYRNMAGEDFVRAFGSLLLHMFNHQTHHRGQVTTLLSQEGLDVGVTDLLALIPVVSAADDRS